MRKRSNFHQKKDDDQESNVNNTLESKYHYESVLSYFKYLVTITMGALSIIAGFFIYTTYQNGNEMKDDMKEKTKELESEFSEKMKKLDSQLGEVRINAIAAANKQIEVVFQKNNIDSFIVNIAKKHMEFQVVNILEKDRTVKTDSAIAKLKYGDYMKKIEGLTYLQFNIIYKLSERQQIELIEITKNFDRTSNLTPSLLSMLSFQNSESVNSFFESVILDKNWDAFAVTQAVAYMIKNNKRPNYELFSKAIKRDDLNFFSIFIDQAITINKKIIIPFLDSKEIVDIQIKKFQSSSEIEFLRTDIKNKLNKYFTEEQLNNTYFFQKTR